MKNLLSLIQDFDNSHLSVKELFDRQKSIFDEIHASTAFGDVSLADGQTLKNMLNGIVANKLESVEQLINSKSSKGSDSSIQEIFAQKVANTVLNTAESTPFYNIGVADSSYSQDFSNQESESYAFPRNLDNYNLISTPQGVVPVLRAVSIDNSPCGLDWVTFSFCQTTFGHKCAGLNPEHVEDAVGEAIELYLDQLLFEIFGFGIAQKREKGMHFNKYGYDLQDNLGLILYGHNNKRITVQINGTGCALARKGWNEQLYKFLKSQAISPKLNRVDIAFDDFESEWVSVDLADQWDSQDLFWCGGRNSEINKLGDWKRINGKGRTLTIGNRSSSKFLRFYERGKKRVIVLAFGRVLNSS